MQMTRTHTHNQKAEDTHSHSKQRNAYFFAINKYKKKHREQTLKSDPHAMLKKLHPKKKRKKLEREKTMITFLDRCFDFAI